MNADGLPLLSAISRICKMNTEWDTLLGVLQHTASLPVGPIVHRPTYWLRFQDMVQDTGKWSISLVHFLPVL